MSQIVPILLSGYFYWSGFIAKNAAKKDPAEYNWVAGHFGDIGISMTFSLGMYSFSRSILGLGEKSSVALSALPAVIASINEYHTIFAENTTDIQDVGMYALGWALAVGSTKFLGHLLSKSKLYDKIPKFR